MSGDAIRPADESGDDVMMKGMGWLCRQDVATMLGVPGIWVAVRTSFGIP